MPHVGRRAYQELPEGLKIVSTHQWVITRSVVKDGGLVLTQYWSGGGRWLDSAGGGRRFDTPKEAERAYDLARRRTSGFWEGEIQLVPVRPSWICGHTGKTIFNSRLTAERVLLDLWSRRPGHRFEKRAYACGGHWHLTSMDEPLDPTQSGTIGS